jgi:hypothetical protein
MLEKVPLIVVLMHYFPNLISVKIHKAFAIQTLLLK